MSEFTPITTQEEFDAAIKARLAREKEKYAGYDQLKAHVEKLETENGMLKTAVEASKTSAADYDKQIADLQGQLKSYEGKELRLRVAVANGLPIELADRLAGDDEEAIAADAERLASFMKPAEPTPPMKSTEPNDIGDADAGWRAMAQSLINEGE